MSRKRPKKQASPQGFQAADPTELSADAVVADEILAEGSGPVDEAPDVMELAAVAEELAGAQAIGDADAEIAIEAVGDAVAEAISDAELDAELEAAGHVIEADDDYPEPMSARGEGGIELEDVDTSLDEAESAALPTSAATMDSVQLKQLLEALVFASDKPITVQRLRQLTRIADVPRLEALLIEIQAEYEPRGLILTSVSGGWQFRTRPQYSAWVQQLIAGRPVRLSRAQLETLAIVAYRQPITRPEIDDIRGVDSSATLKLLLDRSLIRVLGKREEVGRPVLYGTSKDFLDFFSLGDLRELPTLREFSELSDESRQVVSTRLGVPLDETPGGNGGSNRGGGDDSGGGGMGGSDDSVNAVEAIDSESEAEVHASDRDFAAGSQGFEAVSEEVAQVLATDDGDEDGEAESVSERGDLEEVFAEGSAASVAADALDVEAMVGAMAHDANDEAERMDAAGEIADDAVAAEALESLEAVDSDSSDPIEPE